MPIKTSSAKAKGRRAQQLVRDVILAAFPDLSPDDVTSTSMGAGGADVQLSPAAQEAFPFSVEVKARAKIALLYESIEQASRHSDRTPLVVVKADRKRPLVVIDLVDFMKLVK